MEKIKIVFKFFKSVCALYRWLYMSQFQIKRILQEMF